MSRDKSPGIDCFEVWPYRAKVLDAIATWAAEESLHFNYRGASHNPDVRLSGDETGCHVTNTFKRASQEQPFDRQDVVVIADARCVAGMLLRKKAGGDISGPAGSWVSRRLSRDNGSGRLKARATDGYMGAEYPGEALQGASGVARYELCSQQLDSLIFVCTLGVLAQRAERLLRMFVRDIGMTMMCPYL